MTRVGRIKQTVVTPELRSIFERRFKTRCDFQCDWFAQLRLVSIDLGPAYVNHTRD